MTPIHINLNKPLTLPEKFDEFDSVLSENGYESEEINEISEVEGFPVVPKKIYETSFQEIEMTAHWKEASNPKEVANYSSYFIEFIRKRETRGQEQQIKHLKYLKALVHKYTDYCEKATAPSKDWKTWVPWAIESFKALFGQGKRAGLGSARKVEKAISDEIENLKNYPENEKKNLETLKKLPNFVNFQNQDDIRKHLITLTSGSSIVWQREEDGKVIRTTVLEESNYGYLNKLNRNDQVFKDATSYLETKKQQNTSNKTNNLGDLNDVKPSEVSENEARRRQMLIKYNAILDLPENRALPVDVRKPGLKAGFKLGEVSGWHVSVNAKRPLPEDASKWIFNNREFALNSVLEELIKSKVLASLGKDFRILPHAINPKEQIESFICIGAKVNDQGYIDFEEYIITPTSDGYKIQKKEEYNITNDRLTEFKKINVNPLNDSEVREYKTLEEFLSEKGLESKKENAYQPPPSWLREEWK